MDYEAAEREAEELRNLEKQKAARRALKPGEWACLDAKCSHINQEFRNTCDQCGKPKARAKNKIGREIGKDAAEKSKGLFAAEDWSCTKCGNINWARRNTCNICNAPKLGDLERRTGYGGGYMDREDVEYIDREDDEEFDEFGRKKKKGKAGDSSSAPERREETKQSSERILNEKENEGEEDDDDEDDSGDEADLDKYKLDEDDDEDDLEKYDLTADPEVAAVVQTQSKDGS
uniref:Zinc finger Ran-binding domain-containing protein 2 n=1 Tax=Plectus sambesii TaxID=2011161 RepID=A0A914X5H9_9BILA